MVARAGALALAFALGCGPIERPSPRRYFVVFHNRASFAQDVKVRSSQDGAVYSPGVLSKRVAPGNEWSFPLDAPPELVEVEAGWGRVAWSGPEVRGTWVLHVSFPDGASWKGFP